MDARDSVTFDKRMCMKAYVAIARPDHWFKNIFMLFGVMFVFFLEPDLISANWYIVFCVGLIATCLVASSNYVINEVLDARQDRLHPTKRYRPVPSGKVLIPLAYVEWILLAIDIYSTAQTWKQSKIITISCTNLSNIDSLLPSTTY